MLLQDMDHEEDCRGEAGSPLLTVGEEGCTHLEADVMLHGALGVEDGRHEERVPEGRPVLAVVEQAHRAGAVLPHGVADLHDLRAGT